MLIAFVAPNNVRRCSLLISALDAQFNIWLLHLHTMCRRS
ncbi:Hypothetical protein (plasmid) [Pseudomonas putida]|nr:Hypothetical protein [Pseudomonas putida]